MNCAVGGAGGDPIPRGTDFGRIVWKSREMARWCCRGWSHDSSYGDSMLSCVFSRILKLIVRLDILRIELFGEVCRIGHREFEKKVCGRAQIGAEFHGLSKLRTSAMAGDVDRGLASRNGSEGIVDC
jgi:hypothetical protein